VRTAFGTPTREAGDLSAGVYDTQGRMLAQAVTGTPGHVNSMAMSVGHVLNKIPLKDMAEGDVFILNDPWQGTGHLNDIVIVTPTYRRGQAVGFFADTLHVVDIGGRGIVGAAQQVYEEGIYIPITKIVDRGKVNQWLVDLIAANVREPIQVIGDIYSLISSNDIGGRRLREMMDEFELEQLDDLAAHILDHSRSASLAAINKLRPGTYHNEMTVDGVNGKPMTFKAKITVGPDGIDVAYYDVPPTVAAAPYLVNYDVFQQVGVYAQDQIKLTPELTVQGGLRFEQYQTGSRPALNGNFVNRYGFENNGSLNGKRRFLDQAGRHDVALRSIASPRPCDCWCGATGSSAS